MKPLFSVTAFIALNVLISVNVVAQVKHALYYDAHMVQVDDKSAAKFLELVERDSNEASKGTISLYKISADSAILVKKGYYTSVFHPRKVHGQLTSYYPNGKKQSVQAYKEGVPDGLDIAWHDNDSLKHSIGYKQGKYNGELKTYYKSGKLKREEFYKEGKQQYGKCYAENGEETAFVPYREMPEYPGGESAILEYLKQNIRYPMNSKHDKIGGLVVVSFIVNKYGGISEVRVVKSVNDELDKEAMYVISKMNGWKPGTLEGEKVDVRYTLPVRFTAR